MVNKKIRTAPMNRKRNGYSQLVKIQKKVIGLNKNQLIISSSGSLMHDYAQFLQLIPGHRWYLMVPEFFKDQPAGCLCRFPVGKRLVPRDGGNAILVYEKLVIFPDLITPTLVNPDDREIVPGSRRGIMTGIGQSNQQNHRKNGGRLCFISHLHCIRLRDQKPRYRQSNSCCCVRWLHNPGCRWQKLPHRPFLIPHKPFSAPTGP